MSRGLQGRQGPTGSDLALVDAMGSGHRLRIATNVHSAVGSLQLTMVTSPANKHKKECKWPNSCSNRGRIFTRFPLR